MKFQNSDLIYFDNSATSFPKPPCVIDAVTKCLSSTAANPGRSGHRLSMEAGETIFKARSLLAKLFGIKNPMRVIFESNATSALNLAIKGVLRDGEHVITSSLEHNSTIRVLKRLEKDRVITLTILDGNKQGTVCLKDLKSAKKTETKAVVINSMSNVTGASQSLKMIGEWCRKNEIVSIIDCAQSAGVMDINLQTDSIDIVATTAHKALYGPMGVGVMVLNDDFNFKKIKPLKEGGTGSLSDKIYQPDFLPDMFESGTLNVPGIAGLLSGVEFVLNSKDEILRHKEKLTKYFIEKADIDGIRLFVADSSLGVVSFTIEGLSTSLITDRLSKDFNIMSRQGLHCSALTHKKIGTYPDGTVRFSYGAFNTTKEIDIAIKALKKIKMEK